MVQSYMDDLIAVDDDFDEHIAHLHQLFATL
jgi:hypothetical protein